MNPLARYAMFTLACSQLIAKQYGDGKYPRNRDRQHHPKHNIFHAAETYIATPVSFHGSAESGSEFAFTAEVRALLFFAGDNLRRQTGTGVRQFQLEAMKMQNRGHDAQSQATALSACVVRTAVKPP